MQDLINEPNVNLAAILLNGAAQMNGNADDVLLDGGSRARKSMANAIAEITRRFQADGTVGNDPHLKDIVETLSKVEDLADM